MSKLRNLYQVSALYAGPAPDSGFCFIDNSGNLNNNYNIGLNNNNLLFAIDRVQEASFGFAQQYQPILEIGKRTPITYANVIPPSVNFSFSYLQKDIVNELRLGFTPNYSTTGDSTPYYSNNYANCFISGFISRDMTQPVNFPTWPLPYRDKRNLYVIVGQYGVDVNNDTQNFADPASKNFAVYGFGGCYITNYQIRGGVGNFPSASVSYICDNFTILSSGSGVLSPALDVKSGIAANNYFNIPSTNEAAGAPSVLLPGDTNLDFYSISSLTGVLAMYGTGYSPDSQSSNIVDLGVSFSDIKVQNYTLSIPLSRQSLYSLGYKYPTDKKVIFPVPVTMEVECVFGDSQTGNLANLYLNDKDYNATLRINSPRNSSMANREALRYELKRAKLQNISYSTSIGPSYTANLTFVTDIDPDYFDRGLFVSGIAYMRESSANDEFLLKKNDNSLILKKTGGDFILKKKALVVTY